MGNLNLRIVTKSYKDRRLPKIVAHYASRPIIFSFPAIAIYSLSAFTGLGIAWIFSR